MNILSVGVGPVGVGVGYLTPSWLWRGWRAWLFCTGHQPYGAYFVICGIEFRCWKSL